MDDAGHDVPTCMTFPREHRAGPRSATPIERPNGEIRAAHRRRRRLPDDDAILRLVGPPLLEQDDEWAVQQGAVRDTGTHGPFERRCHRQPARRSTPIRHTRAGRHGDPQGQIHRSVGYDRRPRSLYHS
ncbi:transposase [Jannaschia rubra]|uniref:transposase n=1 Tax=Jannaschia rubra TaxID=282197 RepID=UPI0009E6A8C6